MKHSKKSERAALARPTAEERRSGVVKAVDSKLRNDAASQDEQARQFFNRVAKDRDQSMQFLRKAGILDSSGQLAKPYRD
jgi:hypothetical protein